MPRVPEAEVEVKVAEAEEDVGMSRQANRTGVAEVKLEAEVAELAELTTTLSATTVAKEDILQKTATRSNVITVAS